jgi:hypothetical protein
MGLSSEVYQIHEKGGLSPFSRVFARMNPVATRGAAIRDIG